MEPGQKVEYLTARLREIQFGLLSIREAAHLSVITEKDARNQRIGITRSQDLFGPRLGVPNKDQKCATCLGTRRGACDRPGSCDGHFGDIALPVEIYHPHFLGKCLQILSRICLGCCRVLQKKKRRFLKHCSDENEGIESPAFEESMLQRNVDASAGSRGPNRKRKRTEERRETELPRTSNDGQPVEICNYCGGPDGSKSKFPKVKLRLVSKIVGRTAQTVNTIMLTVDEKPRVLPHGFWDFVDGHPTNVQEKTRKLLAFEALRILRRIPKDDIAKLHMDKLVSRPDSFIIKEILVSPNCNRLVREDWSSTLQLKVLQTGSPQTNKLPLAALVRKSNQIKGLKVFEEVEGQKCFEEVERNSENLQLLAARHFRACKVVHYDMKRGQKMQETAGALDRQWLKDNVLGKYSNYSARSIINGDPCILIEEIGVPQEMAMRLTVEEKINALNIQKWQNTVDRYMDHGNMSMLGALILRKKNEFRQHDLEFLREMNAKKIRLGVGDTITRCLRDGDRVFANRTPSLHKHSLITLKVKVHSLSTFSINPLICPPFDADFDGDAFHIFVPQSLESKAETQELMAVPAQLISSQGGQPIIGLTEDSLVAGHLLTSGHTFISRQDMQQLTMWCSSETGSKIPIPAIVKVPGTKNGPLWTGKQLFSMTLPDGLAFGSLSWTGTPLGGTVPFKRVYSPDGDVLIEDGEVLICQGGAKWLGRSPNGVLQAICNHAGPVATMKHLDRLQAVLHQWLLICGFSVSLLDFYAAEDTDARKRMLRGIQKSLEKSNAASLKQALVLDRQIQHEMLFAHHGLISGDVDVEEHQGCFGLLIGNSKSNQRVSALQLIAIQRFQTLAPIIDDLVSGYMDTNNSLHAMVSSGSKGSMSKLIQQVGCLGLHLYKGERLLPIGLSNKLSSYQSLEKAKSDIFYQTEADASLKGFFESRGIIKSSYMDGLNPTELFMDAINFRCNVLREGVEEPYQILKSLMLFMRDMEIAYDGTVRIGRSKNIIQFQYGLGKGRSQPNETSLPGQVCASLNTSLPDEDPEEGWPDLKLAGEPVGVLAATSISEPAYTVKMQSTHQAQVLGTGPVQLLKEVLTVRSKTKFNLKDRICILKLHPCFGKERRALEIQMQLQKVTLEKVTLISAIVRHKLDEKWFAKTKTGKDGLSKPFVRRSPWIGHLQLCKRTMVENKLKIQTLVELLNQKHSGKSTKNSYEIYFSYSTECISEIHPQGEGMCIWFFPVISLDTVTLTIKEGHTEPMAASLESMKIDILPAVLRTTIRGSDDVERVRIFWEDGGSPSRLPQDCPPSVQRHSCYQAKQHRERHEQGELAIEVVMKRKRAGKRGDAWNRLKEACIHLMDMIDWNRSCPYVIQEIYANYGVEAARQNIMRRLTLATKTMGKPVHQSHGMLIADTMTHCGDVTGLGSAGYGDFCRQLSISAPFTQAAFRQPKKVFLDAAARGASENIDGGLTSAVWGRRVPIGTGTAFQIETADFQNCSQNVAG